MDKVLDIQNYFTQNVIKNMTKANVKYSLFSLRNKKP